MGIFSIIILSALVHLIQSSQVHFKLVLLCQEFTKSNPQRSWVVDACD